MKKLSLPFIALTVFLVMLTSCSSKTTSPAPIMNASQTGAMVAEGRLLPVNTQDLSFAIPGQVAEVLVKNGQNVTTGQVLARLSRSSEAEAALARAQQEVLAAQLVLGDLKVSAEMNLTQAKMDVITAQKAVDEAQKVYDSDKTGDNQVNLDVASAKLDLAKMRLVKLETGFGIDPDQLSAAKARLETATAALDSAKASIEALELKSTLTGMVVDLTLQAGERVTAGQAVMTVADFSTWVVKTDNLTELEVVNVKVGQKVVITLDALPNQNLGGEVTQINTRYEEKRGDVTYTVTAVLHQVDPLMRWGMTAAVQFEK